MKMKYVLEVIIGLLIIVIVPAAAMATPGATLLYYETDLGGGTWQYDYTFYNTSDAGESLYSVYFNFSQATTFDWVNIPSGWDSTLNGFTPMSVTLADTYSTSAASDIAAGNNLGLFSFTVDYRAGDISYDAFLSTGSGNQQISGTTSVVPEPISMILFVTGGTILAGRRYLRKK